MNKWSKVKTLEEKPRSVWSSFFKCVRNVIEKAVSICVINLQDRKVKKTSTSQYQSFEHNGMKIYDQQRMVQVQSLEALKALKGSSSKLVQVGSKLVQKWFKFKALKP